MRSKWSGHVSCKRRRVRVSPMNEANTSLAKTSTVTAALMAMTGS